MNWRGLGGESGAERSTARIRVRQVSAKVQIAPPDTVAQRRHEVNTEQHSDLLDQQEGRERYTTNVKRIGQRRKDPPDQIQVVAIDHHRHGTCTASVRT